MNNTEIFTVMSSIDPISGETTLNVPLMDASQRLRSALGFASAAARRRFPTSHGRIDAASRLIVDGNVVLHQDGTGTVHSEQADGAHVYEVNGSCTCPDASRAPEGWCKHRLALALAKKTIKLVEEWSAATQPVVVAPQVVEEELPMLQPVATPVAQVTCPEFLAAVAASPVVASSVPVVVSEEGPPSATTQAPPSIPAVFVTHIKAKPFVQFAGLLDLGHRQGLLSLIERVTHVSDTYVMAEARAEFSDGRVFVGIGDSSPDNVGAMVKPHWRRLAGTRAMARALRNALNISMVAVEELE